jgi:hypothetical protein
LAKYRQKESEAEEAKRKEEEEKQKKAGEFEKVIQTKDEELALTKAEKEKLLEEKKLWDERNKAQDERNKAKLEEVKKTLGEEKFKKFDSFIAGVSDPFEKAVKIEDALELFGTKEGTKGGSGVPDNGGNAGKIAEYKSKLEKGESLTPKERQEYIKILSDMKK